MRFLEAVARGFRALGRGASSPRARALALVSVAAASAVPARASDVASLARAREILVRVGDPAAVPPIDVEGAVLALSTLGASVVPACVATWSRRDACSARRAASLGALQALASNVAGAELRSIAARDPSLERRIGAVRLLAELAHRDALPAWIELAGNLARDERLGAQIAADVGDALRALLARERSEHARLGAHLERLDDALLALVVHAVERAPSEEGIDLVERVLARAPALEDVCIPTLARLCLLHPGPEAEHALERLRQQLQEFEPALRERAAFALGQALDPLAVLHLVDRLDDLEPLVARAALVALQRLSSRTWPADPERWRAWYEGEELWRAERLDALLADVRGSNATRALRALRELALHPLHAHAIARGLGDALETARGPVALACVGAARQLESGASRAALERCAASDEPELAEAARRALVSLLGTTP